MQINSVRRFSGQVRPIIYQARPLLGSASFLEEIGFPENLVRFAFIGTYLPLVRPRSLITESDSIFRSDQVLARHKDLLRKCDGEFTGVGPMTI